MFAAVKEEAQNWPFGEWRIGSAPRMTHIWQRLSLTCQWTALKWRKQCQNSLLLWDLPSSLKISPTYFLLVWVLCCSIPPDHRFGGSMAKTHPISHVFVGIYNYYPFYHQVKHLLYGAWGARALCTWDQPDLSAIRHEVLLPRSAGGGHELRRTGNKDETRARCPDRKW